jgi:RND family efflux transporter MFP subunit
LLALGGCTEKEEVAETPPRPIKTFTVGERAGGMVRRFSGASEAAETIALSFPVSGTVQTLPVNVGDAVADGDVIATLDPEPFEFDLQAARADVEKARADLVAQQGELDRNKTLFEKGWVAAAAVEKQQAAYDAAASTLEYVNARLAIAQRNLNNATLRAPSAGTIARKAVDRYADVAVAQTIVELNSTDGLLVSFAVPETGISRIELGQPALVTFSVFEGYETSGRITEIETTASSGNAYTVKASLGAPPPELKPGMTAQVSIAAPDEAPDAGYLVPLAAVAPGDTENVGAVFKYVPEEGVVRRNAIQAQGVRDNLVLFQDGLAAGDIIAAAGVAFLIDGQRVRLLEE